LHRATRQRIKLTALLEEQKQAQLKTQHVLLLPLL
jgi:hypothetical protein